MPAALEVVRGSRAELDGPSLDPRRLVLYAPEQYATLPFAPYEEASVLGWVKARSWRSREELFVPALAVLMAYPNPPEEAFLFPTSSNGLAAGPSFEEAVLAALLEVVERDAFLHTWLQRLPTRRVDPLTHPDAQVVSLCEEHARCGLSLELHALPTDLPVHVFLALGVGVEPDPEPSVVVGLGAGLDPARAARAALLETTMSRASLRRSLRDPSLRSYVRRLQQDVHAVVAHTDHSLRYALPPALESFAFLRERDRRAFDWSPAAEGAHEDAAQCLDLLSSRLAEQGSDLLSCDLSSADLARFGVRVARVLLPDYQPLHFGRDQRRLGGTRLYALPRRLGFRSTDATIDELNDEPHPLT
jgi:ribosomal protein S12 methylthiotransferase accessory factor